MDDNELEVLEERVSRAVELIHRLKSENQTLHLQNQELKVRLEEHERTIAELQAQSASLMELQAERDRYREREQLIRHKVESLLAKLDSLELF